MHRFFFIAGIAAERRERVRREGHEVGQRESSRDVLDVRVEATIFVDDDNAGQFARGVRGPRKISTHGSRALRRRVGQKFGLDASVVLGDLLAESKVRPQAFQHRRGGETADSILAGTIEKIAAVEPTVDITIEQLENFGRKIGGLHSFHGIHSLMCPRQL